MVQKNHNIHHPLTLFITLIKVIIFNQAKDLILGRFIGPDERERERERERKREREREKLRGECKMNVGVGTCIKGLVREISMNLCHHDNRELWSVKDYEPSFHRNV